MPTLPNPFDPAASDAAAGQAVASFPSPLALDAAADLSDSGDTDCTLDEAAASLRQEDAAVDLIAEIFVGARKMFDPDPAAYPREDALLYDVLKAMDNPHERDLPDVPQGLIEAMEPMPLFLRQAV